MKTLQFKSTTSRLVQPTLLITIFAVAAVSAAAQTNTFPSSGNAGVGTTNPGTKLEVVGTFVSGKGQLLVKGASDHGYVYVDADTPATKEAGINIAKGGATKWGMYVPANSNDLRFYDSADRLTLQAGGNVGIGTTTPGAALHVVRNGSVPIIVENSDGWGASVGLKNTGMGGGTWYVMSTMNANADVGGGKFAIYNEGLSPTSLGYRFLIDNNGNVGIGTTAPSETLHVGGGFLSTIRNEMSTWLSQNVSNGESDLVHNAYYSSGWKYRLTDEASMIQQWNGNIRFLTAPSGTQGSATDFSERLTILQTGNVGVGLANPNYKLDVNGEINATGFRINGTPISAGGPSQWTGSNSIYYNGGNVGIGTTTPGVKLDVNGYIAAGSLNGFIFTDDLNTGLTSPGADKLNLVTGGLTRFHINDLGNVGIGIGTNVGNTRVNVQGADSTSANYALFVQNSSNTNLLSVRNDGNVGIGTTSPQEKLHVAGSIKVDGNINAKYQDMAEWVPSREQLAAGTVVVLDSTKSNQVISSTVSYDTRVAGVISAQPGITLGEGGEGKVLVATTGRVRVKVDASRGAIHIGDLLVTSDVSGVAMKSEPVEFAGRKMHMPGTIIGKALEPMAKGQGEILVLLSLQ